MPLPSRFARNRPICFVARLGIVGSATTFVVRLASESVLWQTRFMVDLIRGSYSLCPQCNFCLSVE
jgi:hypothetical protein